MRTFDFTPLYKSAIGFDRFASLLDDALRVESQPSYPPYDIELVEENRYRITMAVAGFSRDELDIEIEGETLTISGKRAKQEGGGTYLHRGIAARSFERRFQLTDHIKVSGAALENGLLHVDLTREIPEALKPRKIDIAGGVDKPLIEGKAA